MSNLEILVQNRKTILENGVVSEREKLISVWRTEQANQMNDLLTDISKHFENIFDLLRLGYSHIILI